MPHAGPIGSVFGPSWADSVTCGVYFRRSSQPGQDVDYCSPHFLNSQLLWSFPRH
jgi:hypothetical protein